MKDALIKATLTALGLGFIALGLAGCAAKKRLVEPESVLVAVPAGEREALQGGRPDVAVRFGFDSDVLDDGDKKDLELVAILADGRPVVVVGHADERGGEEYNLDLGLRRAEAVRAFLKKQGVFSGDVRSDGEMSPLCSEKSEKCWSMNRRAEILVGENG